MSYKPFNKSWENWIDINIRRNCCKKKMFRKLLDQGFNYDDIKSKLHIDYNQSDNKKIIKYEFSESWDNWINININRKCDKNKLFKILLNNNFDYKLIKNRLNIDYNGGDDNLYNFFNINLKAAIKYNTDKANIYTLENFLTHDECDKLMNISDTNLVPSTITTGDKEPDKFYRTSFTCQLGKITDKNHAIFIKHINEKICNYMGINKKYSEGIQAQKYEVGQEFKIHTDFFKPGTDEFKKHCLKQGNRTWTFMIYLKDTEKGGETEFPKISAKFYPKKGKAIIWNNLYKNGKGNYFTLHTGKPVIKGSKYIITKWFRQKCL